MVRFIDSKLIEVMHMLCLKRAVIQLVKRTGAAISTYAKKEKKRYLNVDHFRMCLKKFFY